MSPASDSQPVAVGRWHQLGAGALVAVLVALQLRAMLGLHEDWPFTSAPMFARYHSAEDPLFELRVFARLADGREYEIVPQRDLLLGELAFRRQFFAKCYGSTDEEHPGGHLKADTQAAFHRRLEAWMRRIARVHERVSGRTVQGVRLEVRRLGRQGTETRRIAEFRFMPGEQVD